MFDRYFEGFPAILLRHFQCYLAGATVRQHIEEANCRDYIASVNLVVVCFICKRQWHHPLFLQIRFVDPGKALRKDDSPSEISWLQGSMLSSTAFAIVGFSNDKPRNTKRLPLQRQY